MQATLERSYRVEADKLRDERRENSRIICNFLNVGDPTIINEAAMIEMESYRDMLKLLPDRVVTSLERSREERMGLRPMLKAALGYEAVLSSIIVDPTAVGTSSAEAKIVPTLVIGKNFMQPGGIPGKTLRTLMRGRVTTLATAGTITFRNRIAATDVITGNIVMQSGAITQDAAAQTNAQWSFDGDIVVRTVGSAGTVFGQGEVNMATAALTVAAQAAKFMGSAGSLVPAVQTWDMNADQYFQQTVQWSLATAYSIQAHQYMLEDLN